MAGHDSNWKDGVYIGPNAQGVYAAAAKSEGPLAEIHNAWDAEYARLLDTATAARERGDAAAAFQAHAKAKMLADSSLVPTENAAPSIHEAARSTARRLGDLGAASDAQRRYAADVRVKSLVELAAMEREAKRYRKTVPRRQLTAAKRGVHTAARSTDARFWLDNKGHLDRAVERAAKQADQGAFA